MTERDRGSAQVWPAGVVAPTRGQTLWTVQAMRGIAALMVVIGHSQSATATIVEKAGGSFERFTWIPWGASVDLFFVISGFIMVHASARLFGREGARAEFLRLRLARIVPLYWLVTTAFLLLLAVATWKGGDRFPDPFVIAASYAFLPADTYADGRLFPVYDLGWTLNYEMFFYALLAVAIAWPRRIALGVVALALVALVAAGSFLPPGTMLWFWTRPIILDFGLGLGIGAMVAGGITLPPGIRVLMAVVALAILAADPLHVFNGPVGTTVANEWPRVIMAGIPVAALLGACVLGREPTLPRAAAPATAIGDASYSLYLLHPFAMIAMDKLVQKLPIVAATPGWLLALGTVAAAIVLALAGYRWIERPMTRALGRRLRRAPPNPIAVPAE